METIGVIGCGLMGSGIVDVCARAGLTVIVKELNEDLLAAGRKKVEGAIARLVSKGKLAEPDAKEVLGRISYTAGWDGFENVDLVVEAIIENEELKKKVFGELDKIAKPDCIFGTNTSSVPVIKIAGATSRPDKVVGVHFFNPVPVMQLVEIIPTLSTSDKTVQAVREFAEERLGKTTILALDRAGFIVNRLLIPYIVEAIRMLESGFATKEDIDAGMKLGCAHPMGPLTLADLVGLDTLRSAATSLYEEFKEPLYAPPPLLCRMVDAGMLGRKTGRGFYDYTS
jgi:3-hydroxybutyryl-CoA dehydrogenase